LEDTDLELEHGTNSTACVAVCRRDECYATSVLGVDCFVCCVLVFKMLNSPSLPVSSAGRRFWNDVTSQM